jgi:CubicO group peptidase (beta-lactamase class C family)
MRARFALRLWANLVLDASIVLAAAPVIRTFCSSRFAIGIGEAHMGWEMPTNQSTFRVSTLALALTATLVLPVSGLHAQSSSSLTASQIARMDAVLAPLQKPDAPGCAVGVSRSGSLVYQRYFGLADLERHVPITPKTKFFIASSSKQFTAMAVVLLALDGKIGLDDDVRKYVPELPDFGDKITIRHLLSHTSGFREETNLLTMAGWRISDRQTENDILRLLRRQRQLNFRPGDEYMYANTGFTLAAVVVSRVTKMSLPEFVAKRIFQPLGMTHTEIVDDRAKVIADRAIGYWMLGSEGGRYRIVNVPYDNVGPTGVLTTLHDLALWDRNFYTMTVGGRAAREMIDTPTRLNDGTLTGYGLGIYIGTYRGQPTLSHAGSDPGFKADFVHFPKQHLTIEVMCNAFEISPTPIVHGIADILVPVAAPTTGDAKADVAEVPPPADIADFAGRYWNREIAQATTILYENGKLLVDGGNEGKFELRHIGGNRFLLPVAPRRYVLTFFRGPDGMRRVRSEIGGDRPVEYTAVPATSKSPPASQYAGLYYSPELDVEWTVAARNDKLTISWVRYGEEPLSPLLPDVFESHGGFFTIEFAPPANGSSPSFEVTTERVRHLKFVRVEPRGR